MPVGQAILTQAPAAGLPNEYSPLVLMKKIRRVQQMMTVQSKKRWTMVYTVTRRENIRSQPVLEPEYGNALAEYVPPLSKFL